MRLFQTAKMKHHPLPMPLAAVATRMGLFRPLYQESPPALEVASLGAQSSGYVGPRTVIALCLRAALCCHGPWREHI